MLIVLWFFPLRHLLFRLRQPLIESGWGGFAMRPSAHWWIWFLVQGGGYHRLYCLQAKRSPRHRRDRRHYRNAERKRKIRNQTTPICGRKRKKWGRIRKLPHVSILMKSKWETHFFEKRKEDADGTKNGSLVHSIKDSLNSSTAVFRKNQKKKALKKIKTSKTSYSNCRPAVKEKTCRGVSYEEQTFNP